jgi:hypothetical protein
MAETLTQESESTVSSRKRYVWIEVGVVVLVSVVPSIFTSEADVNGLIGRRSPVPFLYHALSAIVNYIGLIALVLFIVWRSNDPLARFGLKSFRFGRDLIGGVLLCAILRGTYHLQWWVFHTVLSRQSFAVIASSMRRYYVGPSGGQEYILLFLMCMISGFMQELIVRAYLITRLEELVDSTFVAFLLSTVLFIIYHGYQGYAGVVDAAIFGTIQGVVFCLFRRVAPLAIAHGINNIIAIGRVSWL